MSSLVRPVHKHAAIAVKPDILKSTTQASSSIPERQMSVQSDQQKVAAA